jgi:alkylation response protein AidB-like acyl-CoA dehydrogenase
MDFGFSPEDEAFAEEVRAFLRAHPPESFPEDGMDAGYGSGPHSRAFLRTLGARGWLSMSWPRLYGGEERPMIRKLILLEELAAGGAPFGPLAGPRRERSEASSAGPRDASAARSAAFARVVGYSRSVTRTRPLAPSAV